MTVVERDIAAVAVVIPAHNEFADLPRCLESVKAAEALVSLPVRVVVVLDDCDDGSDRLIGRFGQRVDFLSISAGNVGIARAAGFRCAARLAGPAEQARTWYASTDADTRVDPNWFVRQLDWRTDMVLGVVRVPDDRVPAEHQRSYLRNIDTRGDGHNHVHGANLGCHAAAYWDVGGFAPLSSGEDVDLVARFTASGYRVVRDKRLSVTTSARRVGRAPGGFADDLRSDDPNPIEDAS